MPTPWLPGPGLVIDFSRHLRKIVTIADDHVVAEAGVVFDGGAIEHVFHVTQALKNLMELVRVGGWLIQVVPANNMMGHGFWQLSPEVFYRAFTPENGFEKPIVFVKEWTYEDAWYAAKEPAKIGRRVELRNACLTVVCTMARKTADVEVFRKPPQESDYSVMWEEDSKQKADAEAKSGEDSSQSAPAIAPIPPRQKKPLFRVPYRLQEMIHWAAIGSRAKSPFDPALYDFVPESDLLRGRLIPNAR